MTLEHMDQGLVVLDQSQTVRLHNPRALELLKLPESVLHEGASLLNIRAFQNARGDFALMPPSTFGVVSGADARRFPLIYDWPRPDGTTLEVRRVQLPDGSSVNTFTDVTARRNFEAALKDSERNHRLMAERVEELAKTDELTGVLSRRYIMKALTVELERLGRAPEPCSVSIIDLDFFKRINDRFGHPIGDEVLKSFAIAVSANIRDIDRFGRYGGEEFLLVFPQTSKEQAATILNRLKEIIQEMDWRAISDGLLVTISVGVAQIRPGEGIDDVLTRADAALYGAKESGRNCVMVA
jgi:diguanylate cyclase (GGDEF)-like protein